MYSSTSGRQACPANLGFLEGRKGVVLKTSGIGNIQNSCSGMEHQFQGKRKMDKNGQFSDFEDSDFQAISKINLGIENKAEIEIPLPVHKIIAGAQATETR